MNLAQFLIHCRDIIIIIKKNFRGIVTQIKGLKKGIKNTAVRGKIRSDHRQQLLFLL